MRTWLALLAAPAIVLGNLTALYVFVAPACRWQTRLPLHGLTLASLAFAVMATLLAWSRYRDVSPAASQGNGAAARARFLAGVASGVGAVSIAALVLLGIPAWVISPCQ
jgi:hypothetical protein